MSDQLRGVSSRRSPTAVARQLAIGPALALLLSLTLTAPAGAMPRSLTNNPYSHEANVAFAHFIEAYWNPVSRTFYARSDHRAWTRGTATAGFWWTAELWETVMDDFQRTESAADRALIDAVFDGFVAIHPAFTANFNDDRGWWALGATRAFRLTGEARYLAAAERLADDQWNYWDATFGGGLWWRRSTRDQKNVATNAPAALVNARLYEITGRNRFRRRAVALFRWVDTCLRTGGQLNDRIEASGRVVAVDYTYNYGTYIGAALGLYRITGAPAYLDRATTMADSALPRLTSRGVLHDEGTGDGGGFKGIFVRNLLALATAPGSQISPQETEPYAALLAHNADVAWRHRNSRRLWGGDWSAVAAGPIEVLTDMSAVNLFEAAALSH